MPLASSVNKPRDRLINTYITRKLASLPAKQKGVNLESKFAEIKTKDTGSRKTEIWPTPLTTVIVCTVIY